MDPVPPITAPWAQPLGPTPCSKDLALPARARPPELAEDWRRGRRGGLSSPLALEFRELGLGLGLPGGRPS